MFRTALFAVGLIVSVAITAAQVTDRVFVESSDHPAIEYSKRPIRDSVSELNRKIQAGQVRLEFDEAQGYLRSVLDALNVPIESQVVVFSKTSVQAQRINPGNPRTMFFNDSLAVGWVRGGFVEIASQDPQQGVIFYVLSQKQEDKPIFIRNENCLRCHESYSSLGVPGMLVRSVFPKPDGTAMFQPGSYLTDHRSPLEQRWAGWYVTGKNSSVRHLGNAVITNPNKPKPTVTTETLSLESLRGKFDTDAYVSPYSDIVALMVFDHQMHMMNLITRIGWETRAALYQGNWNEVSDRQLSESAKEFVDYLLFVDETPLVGRIQSTAGFAEEFIAQGPRDSKGRSLRQFDLERRLMRYPCSYMIYTDAFDNLPLQAQDAIYKRVWQVLSGAEKDKKYSRLSLAERRAVVEILRETKMGLPGYFQ